MKFQDLESSTNKLHYMIHAIFENEDFQDDVITIEKQERDELSIYDKYKVRLIDEDPSYNTTVYIYISEDEAICEIYPDDRMCDDSRWIFNYQQNIPMHYEISYI